MSNEATKNIGQHFIIGMKDPVPDISLLNFIKTYNIGGVLFLGKNYSSIEELADSVNMLQSSSASLPLITSVDHEGGRVQRFKEPFTKLPAYREIVKDKTPKQVFEIFNLIGEELLACGINTNFAPVADMTDEVTGVIGDRSLGTDLEKVGETISATIRGFVKSGIICCAKHFPGHGCVTQDSHIDLPISEKTMDELMSYEINLFKKATRAGVQSIMTAHILFKNIDQVPASLSYKFIEDIIRKDFRFTKLVITDDISMGAITKHYSSDEASKLALSAGNDMIIFSSSDIEQLSKTIDSVAKEAEKNITLMEKIKVSQQRIKDIKVKIKRENISATKAYDFLAQSPAKNFFSC